MKKKTFPFYFTKIGTENEVYRAQINDPKTHKVAPLESSKNLTQSHEENTQVIMQRQPCTKATGG